jgi:hypothetical protein
MKMKEIKRNERKSETVAFRRSLYVYPARFIVSWPWVERGIYVTIVNRTLVWILAFPSKRGGI